jgi:ankyrin repeat protein
VEIHILFANQEPTIFKSASDLTRARMTSDFSNNGKIMNDGNLQLNGAIETGDVQAVLDLLADGSNPNLEVSMGDGDGDGYFVVYSPLAKAIENGNIEMVEALLLHNADVQAVHSQIPTRSGMRADSALHHLVTFSSRFDPSTWQRIGVLLLANGADVNAIDAAGYTCLHIAVLCGAEGMCQYLLEMGADLSIPSVGTKSSTVLELSVEIGNAKAFVLLRAAGAKLVTEPVRSSTLLHRVAIGGTWNPFLMPLVNAGLDINALDSKGVGPLDRISRTGSQSLTTFYVFVAMGALPSQKLLAKYRKGSRIGDAIRMDRLTAAAKSGRTELVLVVLEELSTHVSNADVLIAQAAIKIANSEIADVLRAWVAAEFAKVAIAEIGRPSRRKKAD